ncbi:cobyric acid synthase [Gynuella sunshinyii]|uniref:Cobyric acid synthase n=1 Tax=Gynuella sunshinyii YC6258 TaxID=1445510 RepID=A0A0C5VJ96_9GAMM|nr:cobyric acid synthase [Gynuella sunshinyii]AJQ94712.1 cobyric acid synthase [Gynuella sunshinyii YC6258]
MSKSIMIMGCTSDAGKSFVVSVLCRIFANLGQRVVPFKAQNMSNNAAVTREGGEMGRAQYLQAIAARVEPHTDFNPILLKPQANVLSQVVVNGQVDHHLNAMEWHARKERLWPEVLACLDRLQTQYPLILIEGAGSPAEVNLKKSDIVNFAVATHADADVFLVADIDRGGAYAHLLGTFMCLTEAERLRVKGFVLNKFRGDESLLSEANDWLYQQTGVPIVAVLPYTRHRLPEEDAFFHRSKAARGAVNIGLVMYPYASNLDEFDPLAYHDDVQLTVVRHVADLKNLDALILPGAKHVAAAMQYLREENLDVEIRQFADQGKPVLGICGGLQLLGRGVTDELLVEGGSFSGLDILPLQTRFQKPKTTVRRTINWQANELAVYEIHQGESEALEDSLEAFIETGTGFRKGNVYASYLHGLFENACFCEWFLKPLGVQFSQQTNWYDFLDTELDRLASQLQPRLEQIIEYGRSV